MKNVARTMAGVVLFVYLAMPSLGFAQNSKSNASANKNLAANLTSARQEVASAQQGLAQAAGFLKESESRFHFQTRHVSTVRSKVFDEHDKSSALQEQRTQVDKLEKELAAFTKPILDRVHSQTAYRELAKKQAASEKQIKEGVDSENLRNQLLKERLSTQAEMRQLEKNQLDENPQAKAAWIALQEARQHLKEACADRDRQIDQDAALTEAVSELQSSRQALEQAHVAVAAQKQKLAAAEQHLSQAMSAQRAASNRGNSRRRR